MFFERKGSRSPLIIEWSVRVEHSEVYIPLRVTVFLEGKKPQQEALSIKECHHYWMHVYTLLLQIIGEHPEREATHNKCVHCCSLTTGGSQRSFQGQIHSFLYMWPQSWWEPGLGGHKWTNWQSSLHKLPQTASHPNCLWAALIGHNAQGRSQSLMLPQPLPPTSHFWWGSACSHLSEGWRLVLISWTFALPRCLGIYFSSFWEHMLTLL